GHQAQVVGDLGQVDGARLQHRRDGDQRVYVLRVVDQVVGADERITRAAAQFAEDFADVRRVGVEAGPYRRRADVDRVQAFPHGSQPSRVALDGARVGSELLAEPDGDGVLQVRAAHLQDAVELTGLGAQRSRQRG